MQNGGKLMKKLSAFFKHKQKIYFALCALATILLIFSSLLMGSSKITLSQLWQTMFFPEQSTGFMYNIIFQVRLPRMLACILCGGALGVSGLLIQNVLHTPLASPGVVGVNAGAGFAVVFVSCFFPQSYILRIIASFLGAFIAVLIVYNVALLTGASKLVIVLSGIAISSLLSSFTDTLITIYPDAVVNKTAFSIGGFSGIGMMQVVSCIMPILGVMLACLFISPKLEVLTMGDEVAQSLGVKVSSTRMVSLMYAAVLAGCAVSMGGLLSFAGLIAPHMAKLLFELNYSKLILATFWLGSTFMLFCDLLARILLKPFEIPTGIIVSFIGSPFFLFLLFKRKREIS